MKTLLSTVLLLVSWSMGALAVERASISEIQDHSLSSVEKEVVSLAEAMPADAYKFAPSQGSFQGVRTFGQQMSHIAAVINVLSAALLGEKAPETGESENGPASLDSKDAIVDYLKNSFAHAHQAVKTLTDQNCMETVKMEWGNVPRVLLAEQMVSHTFDHYGQAVVYARMNNVVPPASSR